MKDFNSVTLSGRLTRDIELKANNTGTEFVRFSLASNRVIKDGDEWKDKAGFFDLIAWKHTAQFLHKYAAKGDMIFVIGELRHQTWETTDGEKRSKVEIQVNELKHMKKRGDSQPEPEEPNGTTAGAANFDSPNTPDDDIPF